MDRIAGKLEVFWAKSAEQIVVKHEDSRRSDDETGSIMLSPRQARHFASVLLMLAEEAEVAEKACAEEEGEDEAAAGGREPVERPGRIGEGGELGCAGGIHLRRGFYGL